MANTIKQKRGTTDPGASDLVVGELAINTTDGGVFTKTDGGTVVEVGSGGGGGGVTNNADDTDSIGLGTNALDSESAGLFHLSQNTALGVDAATNVTTGGPNVAIGYRALYSVTTADNSVAVGWESLYSTTADENTGLGSRALYSTTTGGKNVAVGRLAGQNNTTGTKCTFLGFEAGDLNTTGSNNIVIGHQADASSATVSNEITLGDSNITSLRIPGLQSGASDGQVLTYNSTNGNITLADASGGGGGLSEFVESQETASPNDSKPVDALTATDSAETNIDVAFVAKGNGATLAQVPDATTAGGNKRGQYATDFQKIRNNAAQVAGSSYSVICGGENNKITGPYASIVGGKFNTAGTGYYSMAGGENTSSSGFHAFVYGYGCGSSGSRGFKGGGFSGSANATDAASLGGYIVQAVATEAIALGGKYTYADGIASAVVGGHRGDARGTKGRFVTPMSVAPFGNTYGAAQASGLIVAEETTDATTATLSSDSSSASTANQLLLDNNTAYYFKGRVIAGVTGAGDTRAWTFEGAIKRGSSASTTALVGTVIKNDIAYDSGAANWDVAIAADTSNGCLKITVTGEASTTIRWVAKIETTEMGF